MSLRIYNTLSRTKEPFEPLQPGRVNMYVCGPTVYDYPHMGHAKTYIGFDLAVRWLRYRGYDVLYVQNITDVGHLTDDADDGEDKIAKRAQERRVEPMQLVETYTREYFRAMDVLGVIRPDISPRATGHVPEMIDLTQRLVENEHAYEVDGNVYFDVGAFKDYGKLSHRRLEDQQSSGRIDIAEGKRDPADFALWKKAGPGHRMVWNSPWGVGYPGWHIECSAMAMKYLGETLDIHGGGVDNLFPHNEDEICQSEACTNKQFVNYWMHTGTVMVGGEKMSKSKGNFKTVLDEVDRFGADVLRFWVVASHYRSPIDYTDEGVREAGRALERLREAVRNAGRYASLPPGESDGEAAVHLETQIEQRRAEFLAGMDDDFNSPAALAALFGLTTEMNRVAAAADSAGAAEQAALAKAADTMRELAGVLGVNLEASEPAAADDGLLEYLMDMCLDRREEARQSKDYALADCIRDGLAERGVIVQDRPGRAVWHRGDQS